MDRINLKKPRLSQKSDYRTPGLFTCSRCFLETPDFLTRQVAGVCRRKRRRREPTFTHLVIKSPGAPSGNAPLGFRGRVFDLKGSGSSASRSEVMVFDARVTALVALRKGCRCLARIKVLRGLATLTLTVKAKVVSPSPPWLALRPCFSPNSLAW